MSWSLYAVRSTHCPYPVHITQPTKLTVHSQFTLLNQQNTLSIAVHNTQPTKRTVRSQFTSLNQQNSLSIASSQHSTNKTHYVLPLIFILNVTPIHVSIHMESSSGNMYQTILHETHEAILYTYQHNMHGVRESIVQHL